MITWTVSSYCWVLSTWPYVHRDISVSMWGEKRGSDTGAKYLLYVSMKTLSMKSLTPFNCGIPPVFEQGSLLLKHIWK